MKVWHYFPNLVLQDGQGNSMLNANSTLAFRQADADRERANGNTEIAALRDFENLFFAKWILEQEGRPGSELIFGNCVRELGLG